MTSGVYIIKNLETNNIKIGCSKNCIKRIGQVKSSLKFNGFKGEIEIINIVPCKRYKLMEKHLHMITNKFRILNSEWHNMSEDDVNNALMRLGSSEYYNR